MTLQEIVIDVFEQLGEPSDLSPYGATYGTVSTTSAGWIKLVGVVNRAMMAIANWKWPNGRQVRMRIPEAWSVFKANTRSGTITGSGTSYVITGMPTGFNLLVGNMVVGATSGATGVVTWSNGTSVVLGQIVGTFADSETVTVYQRHWRWSAQSSGYNPSTIYGIPYIAAEGAPIEIVSVTDLENQTELELTDKNTSLVVAQALVGVPTQLRVVSGGVLFDVFPEKDREFMVRYFRGPKPLTVADGAVEPELPVQFHEAIVTWCKWWGLVRGQETETAYSVKKDLEDFMARTRTEYDLQDEVAQGQVKVYPDGR